MRCSEHAHALNWAIVDVTAEKYYADPILDRATPEILKKQLADGTYDLDSRMRRAFQEIVEKGQTYTHTHTHAHIDERTTRVNMSTWYATP